MKYMKESRDKLTLNLPKGKKDEYKEYAKSKDQSLTELIMSLIEADMQKNSKK
ncbi:antitoxin [Ruminococcus sp. XPD3002]|uniref:antitoxin n=1 Tax=Ruminococcus sp. XPD3002 TaxID=1452269 RepID=UPI000B12C8C8